MRYHEVKSERLRIGINPDDNEIHISVFDVPLNDYVEFLTFRDTHEAVLQEWSDEKIIAYVLKMDSIKNSKRRKDLS